MAHSIVMPALEMAQETGKLLSWRKKEGEAIAKGEPHPINAPFTLDRFRSGRLIDEAAAAAVAH